MKKIILAICTILLYINIFAQDDTPYRFIGIYTSKESGLICGDKTVVNEGFQNLNEYRIKRDQFNLDKEGKEPQPTYLKPGLCAIIYKYNVNHSTMNCSPVAIVVKTGPTLKFLYDELAKLVANKPKHFYTPPVIIYTWDKPLVKKSK